VRPSRPFVCGVWVSQSPTFATNSGIVIDGEDAVLIDPGLTWEDLRRAKRFLRQRGARVRFIIMTHGHWDHLLGPVAFLGVEVIAHRSYLRILDKQRHNLIRQVASWRMGKAAGPVADFVPPRPTVTFANHVVLHVHNRELVLMHTPGHAPDHCAVFIPDVGLLWAGDMLSDREPPMAMDSVPRYIQTLRALHALPVRALVPGHGTPTRDPQEIHRRFRQDLRYLESLQRCVTRQVAQGTSRDETVRACRDVTFVQPNSYPNAHVWNVESAYVALGGMAAEGLIGWEKDWL
jgi:glyoxylase-like metal-dependent hydrolase (beta-lactamase superfamily II)